MSFIDMRLQVQERNMNELSRADTGRLDSPALETSTQRARYPGLRPRRYTILVVPISQIRIPGERHENIRARPQERCAKSKKPSHDSITSVLSDLLGESP